MTVLGRKSRYSTLLRIGLCLCCSVVLAGTSLAQEGSRFAATLGVGTGSGTIMCSACIHAENMGGSTLSLQLTSSPQPHVRVGATLDTWWHSRDTWERGVWDLSAVAFYYPGTIHRGFFIGGGPSYSMMWAMVNDSTGLQRHGWGVLTEMGYELGPQSRLSLTPYVQYSYAWVGNIYYPIHSGIPWARGWKHQVLSLGLGVTFHNRKRE